MLAMASMGKRKLRSVGVVGYECGWGRRIANPGGRAKRESPRSMSRMSGHRNFTLTSMAPRCSRVSLDSVSPIRCNKKKPAYAGSTIEAMLENQVLRDRAKPAASSPNPSKAMVPGSGTGVPPPPPPPLPSGSRMTMLP